MLKACYCDVSDSGQKSRPGLDQNRILVLPSLRVQRIQSPAPELRGITIYIRGNERCLSTCGNCAPDRDQRYRIQSEQTQEVVLIKVQDVEISYREKLQKEKQKKKGIKTLQRQKLKENLQPCQRINTVLQRCARNSGGFEHHRYDWGGGGVRGVDGPIGLEVHGCQSWFPVQSSRLAQ